MNSLLSFRATSTIAASFLALLMATSVATGAFAMGGKPGASSSSSSATTKPSMGAYSAAEKAVKDRQYRKAITMLTGVVAKNPRNVDAFNYLGYSHRQLGEYKKARLYYSRALSINSRHRGANEYLGQLYLQLGQPKAARLQLVKLKKLCPRGCEEYDSLKSSIAKAVGG